MKKLALFLLLFAAFTACTKKVASADPQAPTKEDEAVADGAASPTSAPDETREKSDKENDKATDDGATE